MITKTINMLFKATHYGVWGMSILGLLICLILMVVNFPLGIFASATFLAGCFLSIAIMILLVPDQFEFLYTLCEKWRMLGFVALICSLVLMGIIYFMQGGFPVLNLIFI